MNIMSIIIIIICTSSLIQWVPEIRAHCPDQPVIVVGCGSDMRNDDAVKAKLSRNKMTPVTNEQVS